MGEALVFLDGRMVPASEASLPIFDAGVVLGASVAEFTRTFGHRPYRLDDHLDRFCQSMQAARIEAGMPREEWKRISLELLAHNARLVDPQDDLGLIQFVTPGAYATYASLVDRPPKQSPTVCIYTFPLPFERWADKMRAGAHLVTVSTRHIPPECISPKIKHRSRIHFYLAEQEAHDIDPQAIALLLDLEGNITETSTANILLVRQSVVYSPPSDRILSGVSRDSVRRLAAKLGIGYREQPLPVDWLADAEEAFLTSTPFCLMPVTRINRQPIGSGRIGPIYRELMKAWSEDVGLDIERQIIEGGARRLHKAAARVADHGSRARPSASVNEGS
ncbi:MAG: 4-amino-4-deoxychorismate lyase [Gemmatales bacterium]|nr:MAG: 4-amino-4-deoxychorismate lyase [Gemmatales bacterium]